MFIPLRSASRCRLVCLRYGDSLAVISSLNPSLLWDWPVRCPDKY